MSARATGSCTRSAGPAGRGGRGGPGWGVGGTPVVWAPRGGAASGGVAASSPGVGGGGVDVGAGDGRKLWAFDAGGGTGCSGSPKVCTPLWTATIGDDVVSSPAVAGG